MAEYPGYPEEHFEYGTLPTVDSYRVLELLPGNGDDPVCCELHVVHWDKPERYEAVSYAWGDPNVKAPVNLHGKRIEVTLSLHSALQHFRYQNESRILWADAICTNQENLPERGSQVAQMKQIYQKAKQVLIWLGPDTAEEPKSKLAVDSIIQISDFISEKLDIPIGSLHKYRDVYQEVIFKNRDKLPLPNELALSNEAVWKSLIWLYSHKYFTRVWVVQEIRANKNRVLQCGHHSVIWERVLLVAGYLMMETAWSKSHGFSSTYIWWVAEELIRDPKQWLHILYLASNFSATDPRDMIFGLLGFISADKGAELLYPDYSKTQLQVFRDSAEAALLNFETTDVLLYTTGKEEPSWVPEWNKAMVFRNPFRFGKAVPWKPSGDTKPVWKIDRESNILSLTGIVVDTIKATDTYTEEYFGKAMIEKEEGRVELRAAWQRILKTWGGTQSELPLSRKTLGAAAMAFSFGLDDSADPSDEPTLLLNFIAYLKSILDRNTVAEYVPADLVEESRDGKAEAFGKPVWDFTYPTSSFFVTEGNLVGCSTVVNEPGDRVWVGFGSTYPMVIHPVGDRFVLRGFAYVHGIMRGELMHGAKSQVVEIF